MAVEDITSLSEPRSFAQAELYVGALLRQNQFSSENSATGGSLSRPAFTLKPYINFISGVANALSQGSKGVNFIVSQTVLHALNPTFGMGQIWNPALLAGGPPFAGGLLPDAIDTLVFGPNPGTTIAKAEDRLLQVYNGTLPLGNPNAIEDGINTIFPSNQMGAPSNGARLVEYNIYNDKTPASQYTNLDLESPRKYGLVEVENPYVPGVKSDKPDLSKMFDRYRTGPIFNGEPGGTDFYKPVQGTTIPTSADYVLREKAKHNLNPFFNANDGFGYVSEFNAPTDDETYIPFYFVDLRQPLRRIYFRAFLTTLEETFDPEWNMEKYYGRVDPVATYRNTNRTLSVGFKIVANSRRGLGVMWRKINNFIKMLYPTAINGVLAAGPVVRMRIGDVIADGSGQGLAGILQNVSFNYSDATWEISSYSRTANGEVGKVPQMADVSFTFQVIHEHSPTLDQNYDFDSRNIRRMGELENRADSLNNGNSDLLITEEVPEGGEQ